MEQGIIDNIVSQGALKQLDDLTTKINSSIAAMEKMVTLSNSMAGASTTKGSTTSTGGTTSTKSMDELAKSAQKVIQLETQLTTLQSKLDTELGKNVQTINQLKISISDLSKQQKLNATTTNTQVGAYDRLVAEYQIAKKAVLDMAAAGTNVLDPSFISAKSKAANLGSQLDKLHASTGQYGKGANNAYYSTFQLTQVMRELPNFAISTRVGLMALSNNFPMLADGFKNLAKQIDVTTGKALGYAGAFKAMLKSLLSFNTVLLVLITVSMMWDKIAPLFKKHADLQKNAQNELNKSLKEGNNEFSTAIERHNQLTAIMKSAEAGYISQQDAIDEYNKTYAKTNGEIKTFTEMQSRMKTQSADYIQAMVMMAYANTLLEDAVKNATTAEALRRKTTVSKFREAWVNTISWFKEQIFGVSKWEAGMYDPLYKNQKKAADKQEDARRGFELYFKEFKDATKFMEEHEIDMFGDDKNTKNTEKLTEATSKWIAELIKADSILKGWDINTEDIFGKPQEPQTVYEQHKATMNAAIKALKDANVEITDELKKQMQIEADISREKEQLKQDILRESITASIDLIDGITDYYLDKLDEQSEYYEKIEEQKLKALESANDQGIYSDEEYEARKRAIEDEAQARQDEITKKQEEADRRAFLLKQAAAIAEVWINYFVNIAKFPTLTPLYLTLAAISTAGIAAQSIPYFEKGGEVKEDTFAHVSEKRQEFGITPQGKIFLTPEMPSIIPLEKGTVIYPDASILNNEAITRMIMINTSGSGTDLTGLRKDIKILTEEVKKLKQEPAKGYSLIDFMKFKRLYPNG